MIRPFCLCNLLINLKVATLEFHKMQNLLLPCLQQHRIHLAYQHLQVLLNNHHCPPRVALVEVAACMAE